MVSNHGLLIAITHYVDRRDLCQFYKDHQEVPEEFLRIHSIKDGKEQGSVFSGIDEGIQLVAAFFKFQDDNPIPPFHYDNWDYSRGRVVQTESDDAMKQGKVGQPRKSK